MGLTSKERTQLGVALSQLGTARNALDAARRALLKANGNDEAAEVLGAERLVSALIAKCEPLYDAGES